MSKSKTITLTMSAEQAQIVEKALELYTRVGIGQFEAVLDTYDEGLLLKYEQRENIRLFLKEAKKCAGHPSNGSYGIHNPEVRDVFRAAFDIERVILNRLSLDRHPEGGVTSNFDPPRQISQFPLPTIKSE